MSSFFGGTKALFLGIERAARHPPIRASYKNFTSHFLVIAAVGYLLVSATLLSIVPLCFALLLGPILGTVALLAFAYISCFVLFVMWLIGRFPYSLFSGKFGGLLKPFCSVPQMSFFLCSILIPTKCDQFVMEGVDAVCGRDRGIPIRSEYKKIGFFSNLALSLKSAGLEMAFKIVLRMMPLEDRVKTIVELVVTAFLVGCRLVSVYTVRVKKMSYREHLAWCGRNALRILGFTLPLQFVEHMFGFVGTVLWMGIGYAAVASLVEELVREQPVPPFKSESLKPVKIN